MLEQASPPKTAATPGPSLAKVAAFPFLLAIFAAAVFFSVREGLALRQWAYASTEQFRFQEDINNAWTQGQSVVDGGRALDPQAECVSVGNLLRAYLGRYEAAMKDNPDGKYDLDYPPARLLIMSVWVWRQTDGGKAQPPGLTLFGLRIGGPPPLPAPAELAGPLLEVNTVFELAGMAGAFMLVRAVLRRAGVGGAEFLALVAALLVWFNPAMLIDAHVWPQWDAWLLPFWTWAGYFAVTRRWLVAGLCLGLGAMFKGQLFLTMPFFVLWPLFQLRPRAVVEVVVGILLGVMVYVSPWMLWKLSAKVEFVIAVIVMAGIVPWVWRGWRVLFLCTAAAVSLLLAGLFLGGSFAWWHVGFEYGTRHFMALTMGPTPNLALTLQNDFHWNLTDVLYTVDLKRPGIHADINVRQALTRLYGLALLLCSIGAARHDSRGDRRILLAMATPWVVMFAFLPEMHDRYLVWGAAFTALAAGVSLGSTLLHLAVTFIACLPMAFNLIAYAGLQRQYPQWYMFLSRGCNHGAWVTVLLAIILVYLSLVGSGAAARSSKPT